MCPGPRGSPWQRGARARPPQFQSGARPSRPCFLSARFKLLMRGHAEFQVLMNCFLSSSTKYTLRQSMGDWVCGNFWSWSNSKATSDRP